MNHVIIGRGQVGNVIKENLKSKASIHDKGEWEHLHGMNKEIGVLHICIPYTDSFVSIVCNAIDVFAPVVAIIHSTVKAGTTKEISLKCIPCKLLYSPVNGRHADNFADNAKKYTKLFSGNKHAYELIKDEFFFSTLYINDNTDQLEFSKLMCTTRMYFDLVFQHELHDECRKRGYDYHFVYDTWTRVYNQGIREEHSNWQRPIYDYVDGLPGGHCLRQNLLLDDNAIITYLKKYEDNHEKKSS